MEDRAIKNSIKQLVLSIVPHDSQEKEHIEDISNWIASADAIFRIKKDAIPPKHLVSYSVVVDLKHKKILLFDHKKAQLMLPSGGHVNINEMPVETAQRELREELGLSLRMFPEKTREQGVPFFATVTQTVGTSERHTDVSLWYLFIGDSKKTHQTLGADYKREFSNYSWLDYDTILSEPVSQFDPHMHRFVQKIKKIQQS